tara:strand:+ start:364 stop:627 length:264 start_codon:yes stop_codon:yes gene_type:complete
MMYGIWVNKVDKWLIDGFEVLKDKDGKEFYEEIPSLYKTKKEAQKDCDDFLNREYFSGKKRKNGDLSFRMVEDYTPKRYTKKKVKKK